MTRLYPNGEADINAFEKAGGVAFLVHELLGHGLMHDDVNVMFGESIHDYARPAGLDNAGRLAWNPPGRPLRTQAACAARMTPSRRTAASTGWKATWGGPWSRPPPCPRRTGALRRQPGVFADQKALLAAYEAGEMNRDAVVVLPGQGPAGNGMPELHKLMPALANLQADGYKVALLTDGPSRALPARCSVRSTCIPRQCVAAPLAGSGTGIGSVSMP